MRLSTNRFFCLTEKRFWRKLELISHQKISQIRLIVRTVVADEFDIRLTFDLFIFYRSRNFARAFPIDDHRRAARVEFLIFDDGRDR